MNNRRLWRQLRGIRAKNAPAGFGIITLERQRADIYRWWWKNRRVSFLCWLRGPTKSIPKPIQRAYRASGHHFRQAAL